MSGLVHINEATEEQKAEAAMQQTRSGPPTPKQIETIQRMREDRGIVGEPDPKTNAEATNIISQMIATPATAPARQEQLDQIDVLAKQLDRTFVNDGWTVDRAGAILYRLRQQAGRRNAQRLASVTDPVGVEVEAKPKDEAPASEFDAITEKLREAHISPEKLDEFLGQLDKEQSPEQSAA